MFKSHKIIMGIDGYRYYEESSYKNSNYNLDTNEFKLEKLRKGLNLHIIIEGKEVFIEEIEIPRIRKNMIYQLVECALIERFHSLNEIAFDYIVKSRKKETIEIIVYCLNLSNLNFSKENFGKAKIKTVITIQQLYIKYFIKRIKSKEFYGVVSRNKYIYLFHVSNNRMVENNVVDVNLLSNNLYINSFLKKVADRESKIYLHIHEEEEGKVLKNYLSNYEKLKIYEI